MDKQTIENHFTGHFQMFYERYLPKLHKGNGAELKSICPFHPDTDPSLSVNTQTGVFKCFGCNAAGSIFDFYARQNSLDTRADFPKILNGIATTFGIHKGDKQTTKPTVTARYDYQDEAGKLVYQIERLEPKSFRIRQPDGQGWAYNAKGITIIPYRLPEFLKADEVLIPEGEKDVDNLRKIGFTATTNPFGAGKWPDHFGPFFAGKHVVLIPHNDEPGLAHMKQVAAIVKNYAASIRWLKIPDLLEKGDVSDFLVKFTNREEAAERLAIMIEGAAEHDDKSDDQKGKEADGQTVFKPLTPADTLIRGRLIEEPASVDAIVNCYGIPMLTRGIVGGIIAEGGAGKTYWFIQTALMMARAVTWGPMSSPDPLNVLALFAEDPQEESDRRLWRASQGDFPPGLHAVSVTGKIGPLMELNNGNPARSKWYDWLRETIENHVGLDVLMLDPKSRFYGLVENDNDHNTQWVACLESLAITYNLTILFSHHVSKQRSGEMTQHMSRGGSSLVDGCRWVVGLTGMSEKTAERYDVNYKNFIEMDLVKSNYTAKLQHPLLFEKDQVGLLHYRDLGTDRIDAMTRHLVELLTPETTPELTRRELRRDSKGKSIAEAMEGEFARFTRSKDIDACLDYGIKKGWLSEINIGAIKNKRIIIRVKGMDN